MVLAPLRLLILVSSVRLSCPVPHLLLCTFVYPRPGGPKVLEWLTVDFRRPVPSMGAFASKCMPLVSGYQHSITPPKDIALETGRERGILQRILRRPIKVGGEAVWSGLGVWQTQDQFEFKRCRVRQMGQAVRTPFQPSDVYCSWRCVEAYFKRARPQIQ